MYGSTEMNRLLNELERLAEASQSGELIMPDTAGMSGDELKAANLVGRILSNYRDATEKNKEEGIKSIFNGMDALNRAAIIFLSHNTESFRNAMSDGIGIVAGIAGINRMSVSRNIQKPDGLYASQIFRWSQEAGSAIPSIAELRENSYDRHIPRWRDVFESNRCINGPVRLMPEAGALEQFGCVTALAVPVFIKEEFWGFVLYEDLSEERTFTENEVMMLRAASVMIASAVIRNDAAEKALAADEHAKLLLEATPLSCVLWNSDRQVIDCNDNTVRLHGFSDKAECLAHFQERFAGSSEQSRHLLNKAFDEGYSSFEWTHHTPDGQPLPVGVKLVRVKYGDDCLVAGYAQDLREYKRMMSEVDRNTRLLQTVNLVSSTMLATTADTFDNDLLRALEIMAEAVKADRAYLWENFTKDGQLCCRQVYEWSGGAQAQQGKAFTLETAYRESVPEWEEGLSKGLCINNLVRNLSENEQTVLVPQNVLSIIALPIFIKGQFWGFLGFDDCHKERRFSENEEALLRSASELIAEALIRHNMEQNLHASAEELQRALSEAEAASMAKGEFLSNMSHEMRTPLNAVIGMTAIGLRSAEAERKNYALEKIEEASTHLLGVINDVLDMSKIEAGELELSPAEFNLEQMLQKVITVISYRVNEKRQKFTVNVDGNVPRFVIGDDQRLTQIITNLLANASKFTPEEGEIHLGVSMLGDENGVSEIRVEVADSGIGISAEQQSKLFQSFKQAESGISREYGGTGLGLAISKRLVEMMEGRIWVESEKGKGSRFIFTAKVPNGVKNLRSLLVTGVKWDTVRVLAVDGSGYARQHLKETFDRLGVQCETAADGTTACHIIEKYGAFDIYFIDLYTPGINGVRLAQWIRSRGESGSIILTSSAGWENLQEAVKRFGADKGLEKPILSSALVDCMNECLGIPHEDHTDGGTDEFAGKSLLLAEDIEINREIVLTLLEDTGLQIDCAENGKDALALMEAHPEKYDMIFMDMQMPFMDGLEATRKIRALSASWCKEIPIIAMTANVFKDDIASCIKAGMNDHMGKPINFDDMMGKLRRYLLNTTYTHRGTRWEGRSELALFRGDDRHTARLAHGTKVSIDIRVFDSKGKRGSLSLPTVVEEVYPDGFFLVQMPKHHCSFYPLPRDVMFLIYFTEDNEQGGDADMFVIPARFVERIERQTSVYAKLEPLGRVERSQRRDCYRLPLSISVSLRRADGEDEFADGRMINFSDGGMLIATDVELKNEENITLDFSIGDRETVEGVVLRTEETLGRPRFSAAIEFSNAGMEQKERFYKFIMEKQIERAASIKEDDHGLQLSLPIGEMDAS